MAAESFDDGSKNRRSRQNSGEQQFALGQTRSEFTRIATTMLVAICALTNQRG